MKPSSQELEAIIDHLEEGVFLWNSEAKYFWLSPRLRELLALDADETLNRLDAMCQFQDETVGRQLSALLAPGSTVGLDSNFPDKIEGYLVRNDGLKYPMQLRCYLLPEKQKNVTLVIGIILDTRELVEAREALDESLKSKEDFLSKVSHEIRTPLNGVVGMIHLLSQSNLSETQSEYLSILKRSNDSIIEMITEVLDYYKIETGQITVKSSPFSLEEVIKILMTYHKEKADEKKLDFAISVAPSTPNNLRGDIDRLIQIVTNLLSNAIKFTEKGEVNVNFSLAASSSSQDKAVEKKQQPIVLRIEIKDTGAGIPPEKLLMIFDKFSQANTSPADVRGLGLGLAICKQLADLMNGIIRVQSDSKGSCFTCELPMLMDSGVSEENVRSLEGLRCLAIDDSLAQQALVQEVVVAAGGVCDTVSSAHEGFKRLNQAAFNQTPYHVVIIDYLMSEVDGLEACQRLTKMTALGDLKRILLTSELALDATRALFEDGFHGYLTKPLDSKKLILMISSLYKNKVSPDKLLTEKNLEENILKSEPIHFGLKTILMADDNQVNRMIGKKMLGGYGCNVLLANDGAQVIDVAKKNSVNLILMDCQMPVKDGYEATKELKALMAAGQLSAIPIVALTANATEKDKQKCLAAGMDDYLSKPIQTKELLSVLSKYLMQNAQNEKTSAKKELGL